MSKLSKKTQDLLIAIGLLLIGYFCGNVVLNVNKHSPVKIPETIEEVREIDIFKEWNNKNNNKENTEVIIKFDRAKRNWDKMEIATVKYIIDGDTIILDNGEKVRYISINTPERGNCWYQQAKRMNQDLVSGQKIKLEQDISNKDKYKRLLRYIYVGDKNSGNINFVNMELVKAGLARVKKYKPDLKYFKELEKAENYAKQNKIGLWGGCEE